MKIFALIFILLMCYPGPGQQEGFSEMVNRELSHTAPVVYVKDLAEWMTGGKDLLLLDARSYPEYKVSHIRDAHWIGENYSRKNIQEKNKNKLIVVYCSIGYRSEKVSDKLISKGYKNVFNLWGGIFDWINKGNPVVDPEGNTTELIHPYNEKWGKWLTRGIKKYE